MSVSVGPVDLSNQINNVKLPLFSPTTRFYQLVNGDSCECDSLSLMKRVLNIALPLIVAVNLLMLPFLMILNCFSSDPVQQPKKQEEESVDTDLMMETYSSINPIPQVPDSSQVTAVVLRDTSISKNVRPVIELHPNIFVRLFQSFFGSRVESPLNSVVSRQPQDVERNSFSVFSYSLPVERRPIASSMSFSIADAISALYANRENQLEIAPINVESSLPQITVINDDGSESLPLRSSPVDHKSNWVLAAKIAKVALPLTAGVIFLAKFMRSKP